ncbi:hypothetical protein ACJX0J_036203, partial [Zea mays]
TIMYMWSHVTWHGFLVMWMFTCGYIFFTLLLPYAYSFYTRVLMCYRWGTIEETIWFAFYKSEIPYPIFKMLQIKRRHEKYVVLHAYC